MAVSSSESPFCPFCWVVSAVIDDVHVTELEEGNHPHDVDFLRTCLARALKDANGIGRSRTRSLRCRSRIPSIAA